MNKVKYLEWENILLDTSVVIKYLHALRDGNHHVANFVKRVIDNLNTTKNSNGKARKFYVSSVTISELYDKSGDISRAEKIVRALNIKGVTFLPFDNDIAEFMTNKYHGVLGTNNLKKIARDLSFPEHDLLHGRQWIEKDVMILATAEYQKCDVVLSMDKNTMLPLSEKLDVFCCIVEADNFQHNDTYIFEYGYGQFKAVV